MTERLPNDAYWVTPGRLMAGPYAGAEYEDDAIAKLESLTRVGVTHFLDLTEEGEPNHFQIPLSPYETLIERIQNGGGRPATYRRMPIRDTTVPTLSEMRVILDHLSEQLGAGETVYVHCWGGTGRTGTVVGCHLVESGMPADRVVGHIATLRGRTRQGRQSLPAESPPGGVRRELDRLIDCSNLSLSSRSEAGKPHLEPVPLVSAFGVTIVARMRDRYRLIDLFAGCGGMTLGFVDTGRYRSVLAVEWDKDAAETYRVNFSDQLRLDTDGRRSDHELLEGSDRKGRGLPEG